MNFWHYDGEVIVCCSFNLVQISDGNRDRPLPAHGNRGTSVHNSRMYKDKGSNVIDKRADASGIAKSSCPSGRTRGGVSLALENLDSASCHRRGLAARRIGRTIPGLAACAMIVLTSLAGTALRCPADSPPPLPQVAADATALPVTISASDRHIRYVGRFDTTIPSGPRCEWSASSMDVRFQSNALNVMLNDTQGNNEYEVVVDGEPSAVLDVKAGLHAYNVFSANQAGIHTLSLVRRTEAFFGPTQFLGFQLPRGGKLDNLPKPNGHRIEVIGDSISCGFGNEGKDQNDPFTAQTENAYETYGAITARTFDAQYTCIAWSGRLMWPTNTVPEIYDRSIPTEDNSTWDFSRWKPDVVVINLGTNDFRPGIPDQKGWTGGYEAFLARVRKNYPKAIIYCATSPMLYGKDWNTEKGYLTQIVADETAEGDQRIRLLDVPTQDPANGLGAQWHPNVKTHKLMASQLIAVIASDLKWSALP